MSLNEETNSLLITNQILLNQMKFLHHAEILPTSTLTRETYEEMKNKELPGLYKICEKFLREWKMDNFETIQRQLGNKR